MRRPSHFWLQTIAFISGASILVIELMGTRLLAPFFGSGIHTWSAIITITMAALALGYQFGGFVADRRQEYHTLSRLIAIAALWLGISPFLAQYLLPQMLDQLSLWQGAMLGAALLFFPSLFCLAGVGPFVIRLITVDRMHVGRTSGSVFAISTIGSLSGALFAAFYLMANVAVSKSFLYNAMLLAVLALPGLFATRRTRDGLGAIFLLILLLTLIITRFTETPVQHIKLIDQAQSFYGAIKVIEKDNTRIMLVDGIGQNYLTAKGDYSTPYIHFIRAIPALESDTAVKRALVIGLGAGEIPMHWQAAGLETHVVEIDPKVVQMAQRHFGFTLDEAQIHVEDGRRFIETDTQQYDYLVVDAFSADLIAPHLFSREALQLYANRLTPAGLLIVNVTAMRDGEDIAAIHHTLQQVFPQVVAYHYDYPGELDSQVIVASHHPRQWSQSGDDIVDTFLSSQYTPSNKAIVLSDDFNPLPELRMHTSLLWRREMWDYLGSEDLGWLLQ